MFLSHLGPVVVRRHVPGLKSFLIRKYNGAPSSCLCFKCEFTSAETIGLDSAPSPLPPLLAIRIATIDEEIAHEEGKAANARHANDATAADEASAHAATLRALSFVAPDGARHGTQPIGNFKETLTNAIVLTTAPFGNDSQTTCASTLIATFARPVLFVRKKKELGLDIERMAAVDDDGKVLDTQWDEIDEIVYRLKWVSCEVERKARRWFAPTSTGKFIHIFDRVDEVIDEVEKECDLYL